MKTNGLLLFVKVLMSIPLVAILVTTGVTYYMGQLELQEEFIDPLEEAITARSIEEAVVRTDVAIRFLEESKLREDIPEDYYRLKDFLGHYVRIERIHNDSSTGPLSHLIIVEGVSLEDFRSDFPELVRPWAYPYIPAQIPWIGIASVGMTILLIIIWKR